MSIDLLSLDVANKALDAIWQRASVISDNIANSDTPNYKSKDIEFENLLADALNDNSLTQEELSNVNPVETTSSGSVDANGNNVDVDDQMVELARNQLQYYYMDKSVSNQLDMLAQAASEGKS